jgi:hypothetical protein
MIINIKINILCHLNVPVVARYCCSFAFRFLQSIFCQISSPASRQRDAIFASSTITRRLGTHCNESLDRHERFLPQVPRQPPLTVQSGLSPLHISKL